MKNILHRLAAFLWLAELNPSPGFWDLLLLKFLGRSRPSQWFNLLLRQRNHQKRLEGIAAAARNARMASLREAKRRKRLIAKKTRLANRLNALAREWRHCRRRWRVRRVRIQTHLRRWLLVNLLSLLLWSVLQALRVWCCLRSWRGR